jgi:hypothetical protein
MLVLLKNIEKQGRGKERAVINWLYAVENILHKANNNFFKVLPYQ